MRQSSIEQLESLPALHLLSRGTDLPSVTETHADDTLVANTYELTPLRTSSYETVPGPRITHEDPHTPILGQQGVNSNYNVQESARLRRRTTEPDENISLADFLEMENNSGELIYPQQLSYYVTVNQNNAQVLTAPDIEHPQENHVMQNALMTGAEHQMQLNFDFAHPDDGYQVGEMLNVPSLSTNFTASLMGNATWESMEGNSSQIPQEPAGVGQDFRFPDFCEQQYIDSYGIPDWLIVPDTEHYPRDGYNSLSGMHRLVTETPGFTPSSNNTGVLNSDSIVTPPINEERSEDIAKGKMPLYCIDQAFEDFTFLGG